MQPIETHYAGCRFRSRLEARWAVFFDTMGIEWEYEPQGYMVGPHQDAGPLLDVFDHRQRYLPDFWLPELEQWIEVKGSKPDHRESCLMAHSVVTHPGWGLANNHNGLLLLGPIPNVLHGVTATHPLLKFHKGDVWLDDFAFPKSAALCATKGHALLIPAIDCRAEFELETLLFNGSYWNSSAHLWDEWVIGIRTSIQVRDAYRAARSARFEHGEAG